MSQLATLALDPPGTKYTSPESIAEAGFVAICELPEEDRQIFAETKYYPYARTSPAPAPTQDQKGQTTLMGTVSLDSFEAARAILQHRPDTGRPLVLNLANEYNCGGGFHHGWGSQEECLFRRSTLFYNLWPHRRTDDSRWPDLNSMQARQEAYYPLTDCGGIYSPHVGIIRHEHSPHRSAPLPAEERAWCSCVSAAAQDLRFWTAHRTYKFSESWTTQKLRTILSIAVQHGHRSVVLGAFGCGAFQNDPKTIARLFHELLDGEFQGCFSLVVFAIIKSKHNLASFSEYFPLLNSDLTAHLPPSDE